MRGTDNRAQIVRILDAIENDMQAFTGNRFFQRCESLGRSEANDALMGRPHCGPIEHFARLESHRNAAFARQIDDFLDTRSGRPLGDQDTIKRTPGP
jgi:hypothetical protein